MKPRLKTSICLDWLRARENRLAPAGAPPHWGCPRGRRWVIRITFPYSYIHIIYIHTCDAIFRCEFAHGEEELKGEMLKRWQQQQKDVAKEQQEKKKDDYIGVLYRANKQEDDLNDIISAGLKAEAANKRKNALLKKAKTEESSYSLVVERESNDDADEELDYLQLLEADSAAPPDMAQSTASASVTSTTIVQSSSSEPAVESVVESNAFMEIVAGQFSVKADGEITSRCEFGSVIANDFTFPESNYSYFEVELLTNGLMQIGWARKSKFVGSVSGGDGVGDDGHSWSFDGLRWRCWHFGQDAAYGPANITAEGEKADGSLVAVDEEGSDLESWLPKDIVGCAVQYSSPTTTSGTNRKIDEVECCISFSLNGENFGPAFRFTLHRSKAEAHIPGMNWAMLSPALSLADGEKVRVNLGHKPFEYGPKGRSSYVAPPVPLNESNAAVPDETTGQRTETEKAVEDVEPIELESDAFADISSLEALGLRKLQIELTRRGLKAGGSLSERAQRLLSVRGLAEDKVPKSLKAKKN